MPHSLNRNDALRERRRRNPDRTRAEILTAATEAFASFGREGASVNAIADAAGVNKRMLYHYFVSKDGLYLAVLEAIYDDLRNAILALKLTELTPPKAIAALATGLFDHAIAHPEVVRLISIENMSGAQQAMGSSVLPGLLQETLATLDALIRRGVTDGTFRPVDAAQLWMTIVAIAWFQIANRHTMTVIVGSDPVTPQALAARRRHVVDVALATLRP